MSVWRLKGGGVELQHPRLVSLFFLAVGQVLFDQTTFLLNFPKFMNRRKNGIFSKIEHDYENELLHANEY
jgi:hypothetical protein